MRPVARIVVVSVVVPWIGCMEPEPLDVGATEQAVSTLVWRNAAGVAVNTGGSVLRKTSTSTSWNAGASSAGGLAGDGWVEFSTAENTTAKAIGLSNGDSTRKSADIDFALFLKANGVIAVYEAGAERAANVGTYVAGDVFRIEVSAGVVRYRKNGGVLYTSTTAPVFPLCVDTSFLTPGGTVSSVDLVAAITWRNLLGVAASGNDLLKFTTAPQAGASSWEVIGLDGVLHGSDYVEFTTGETNRTKLAGLNHADTATLPISTTRSSCAPLAR